jgi:hypothetical protein
VIQGLPDPRGKAWAVEPLRFNGCGLDHPDRFRHRLLRRRSGDYLLRRLPHEPACNQRRRTAS